MIEMLLGFVVMVVILLIMSVGVIMGRKPITGSCGGVAAALGDQNYVCDLCGNDPNKCETEQQKNTSSLGYNALDN